MPTEIKALILCGLIFLAGFCAGMSLMAKKALKDLKELHEGFEHCKKLSDGDIYHL